MNGRTAKLLRKFARDQRLRYRQLKRAWNDLPRPQRHPMRRHMLDYFS